MGKKKFIDKKNSATFQLLARDSSDPNYSDELGSDRVFVRVDNNPVSVHTIFDEDNHCYNDSQYDEEDSIFADAPDDKDEGGGDYDRVLGNSSRTVANEKGALPENVRREILELGYPDDGYNYLIHLREIRNTGGGSAFYHNPKFKPDQLPRDVKAYDASRIPILKSKGDYNEKSIYSVASKTLNARMQKLLDPEVAALLDDSDMSRFGSDVEDLEEDFIVRANTAKGEGDESDKKLDYVEESKIINEGVKKADSDSDSGNQEIANEVRNYQVEEKPQAQRLLDEQFDILELQEYGTDDDECDGYIAEEEEFLADKLKYVLNENVMDDLELDNKYKAPADILHGNESPKSKELLDSAADIMRRCAEYAEKYENESEDEKVLVVQDSSDESEQFDCESIISTYSTLDNHPGKIEAPEVARKKKLAETVSGVLSAKSQVISLRGKENLPVDFLPNSRKAATEKVKVAGSLKPEQLKKKQHGQETKEEKKERKLCWAQGPCSRPIPTFLQTANPTCLKDKQAQRWPKQDSRRQAQAFFSFSSAGPLLQTWSTSHSSKPTPAFQQLTNRSAPAWPTRSAPHAPGPNPQPVTRLPSSLGHSPMHRRTPNIQLSLARLVLPSDQHQIARTSAPAASSLSPSGPWPTTKFSSSWLTFCHAMSRDHASKHAAPSSQTNPITSASYTCTYPTKPAATPTPTSISHHLCTKPFVPSRTLLC